MKKHNVIKKISLLIVCMLLVSCSRLIEKTGESIYSITPEHCIGFGKNISQMCLFPFSFIKGPQKKIVQGKSIPLGFKLKSPGYYNIHANVKKWEYIGNNYWKSMDKVEFQCNIHDSQVMLGDISKLYYFFESDIENREYYLNMAPYSMKQGTYPLYIYIQSQTKPRELTINFGDKNEKVQQYIMFRPYFIKLNNQSIKHYLSVKLIKKRTLGLFLESTHITTQKKQNTISQSLKKSHAATNSKISYKRISKNINPSGLLLCKKGNQFIEASVRIQDWEKKGDYWQGLMYTYNLNGDMFKGFIYQKRDDFGPNRYEVKLYKPYRTDVPLLINIHSVKKPGLLTFNYHVNYLGKYPKFVDFTELQKCFSLDGAIPSAITSSREKHRSKRTGKVKLCPALKLLFLHEKDKSIKKEIIDIQEMNKTFQAIKQSPESIYKSHALPTLIRPDNFTINTNKIITSGIYFHIPGTYLISASISDHEWVGTPGQWHGMFYNFKASFGNNQQLSRGFLYKNDNLDGRFQVNFGKEQVNGKPLNITVLLSERPGDLWFQFQKTVDKKQFVPFNEISNAFFLQGKKASWLNDGQPINLSPEATLFFHTSKKNKQTTTSNVHNQKVVSKYELALNEKIGILPFYITISDELSERLHKTTVNKFHHVVMNTFQKEANISVTELEYPYNIEPFSPEAIDIPGPTIEVVVEETPLYILGSICNKNRTEHLIFGHFVEDLMTNELIITIRLMDCQSKTYNTFVEKLSMYSATEGTVQNSVKRLIKKLETYIKRTI